MQTIRHRAATLVLESAILIAPVDSREWGQAMLSELAHIKNPWAAFAWALGGSAVLVKRSLICLLTFGRSGRAPDFGCGNNAQEDSMRKAALLVTCGCILSVMLLFAAPAFRQAFALSLAPWHWVFKQSAANDQEGLHKLAQRAEEKRDAEGIAFCAMRMWNGRESARLAEEAVRLDPNLTWIYAVVAVRHSELPEVNQWVPHLEQLDPHNTLPYLITAESRDILHVIREDIKTHGDFHDPEWQAAMAAAFQATTLDDYLDRVNALEGKVITRYGLTSPDMVLPASVSTYSLPTYTFQDCSLYAKSILEPRQESEGKSEQSTAMDKYWSVAHYGQMIESQAHSKYGQSVGKHLQRLAYRKLQAAAEKEGNHFEAEHFAYLLDLGQPKKSEDNPIGFTWGLRRASVAEWSAAQVVRSGLMMFVCAACVALAGGLIVRKRRNAGTANLPRRAPAAALGIAGAAGLLLSSVTLYLTYHPYALILDQVLAGDWTHVDDLQALVSSVRGMPPVPLGVGWRPYEFHSNLNFAFYFWLAVIALALAALLLVAARHFRLRPRAAVQV